jgi:hypothetical protein
MAETPGASGAGTEQVMLRGGVGALAAAASFASLETGVPAIQAAAGASEAAPTVEQAGESTGGIASFVRIPGMRYDDGPGTIMHIIPRS